jgi:hypothetical protein
MTANNNFLHLKVGLDFTTGKQEEGFLREKATHFYWGVYQFLNKAPVLLRHDPQARVLRLSFEDDFEEERFEEDDFLDGDFIPVADLLKEEDDFLDEDDSLEEEEASDLKDELFYK